MTITTTPQILTLIVLLLMPQAALHAAEFHVAPTGDDANSGTSARPIATLERARDAFREQMKAGRFRPIPCAQIDLYQSPLRATWPIDQSTAPGSKTTTAGDK